MDTIIIFIALLVAAVIVIVLSKTSPTEWDKSWQELCDEDYITILDDDPT